MSAENLILDSVESMTTYEEPLTTEAELRSNEKKTSSSTIKVIESSLHLKTRGRKPSDDPNAIKDIIVSNKNRILNDEGNLYPATHKIWSHLKQEFGIKKSPKALHSFVQCNKWNVKYDLGIIERSNSSESDLTTQDNASGRDEYDSDGGFVKNSELKVSEFKLPIPKEKWNIMKPIYKEYKRESTHEPHRVKKSREYLTLAPGIWTDVITELIYDAKRLPCSWSFKGNYVSQNYDSTEWIKIRGKCGCGSILYASCPNPPPANHEESGIVFNVKIWRDPSKHAQLDVRKRKLTSEKRWDLGNQMISKNVKASKLRKQMASGMMNTFDSYPAHLPSNSVLRKIKHQASQRQRLNQDPIQSLLLLKYSNKYKMCIQEIGLDPFYIHIITPDQIRLYNLYCKKMESRLIIDATGKVVQKLRKAADVHSKHIFLYLGVINIPGQKEGQIPVLQMLSERHNTNAISYWLSEWRRQGAIVPKEVVMDDSAALISAACRALADEKSSTSYIENSFQFMLGNGKKPSCIIRIDVAHFTNMVRKWPEIVSLNVKQKEFFVRCAVIVAKCTNLDDIKLNLLSFFITCMSQTEGVDATGESTPCEIHKKYLIGKISGIESNPENAQTDLVSSSDSTLDDAPAPTLKSWITLLLEEAKNEVKDDGDRDNIMFNPAIAQKFKKLCYSLPLWCAAVPTMAGIKHERAVGAYIENEFNNIKNRLITSVKRVDDFVIEYFDILDGTLKLSSSSVISKNTDDNTVPPTEAFSNVSDHINEKQKESNCPLCKSGQSPEGGLTCKKCNTSIHKLNECSSRVAKNEEESFGEARFCLNCANGISKEVYITDYPSGRKDVEAEELSLVEGWKGLSVPPKKRKTGFYWKPNPEFALLLNTNNKKSNIGILLNGSCSHLKPIKTDNEVVSPTNTCSIDAPLQIFAAAYCDSLQYRDIINSGIFGGSILDVAKCLVTKGATPASYRKRAIFLKEFLPSTPLKGGLSKIDCLMDSSSLLKRTRTPPSIYEEQKCSSMHCPRPKSSINIVTISPSLDEMEKRGIQGLREALETADQFTQYKHVFTIMNSHVPHDLVIRDPSLSQNPLCAGTRSRKVTYGPHLLIEIVGSSERLHNQGEGIGVIPMMECRLHNIPHTLQYTTKTYYLRGVVAFYQAERDNDAGHYKAFCLRPDNNWEMYDDLISHVTNVRSMTLVPVHILIYTI